MVKLWRSLAVAVLVGLAALPVLWPQGALMGAPGDLAVTGPAPRRVVSINLCTDQLAMLLAGPEQLYSVSVLAADPRYSTMVTAAAAYPANRGLAEEVYLMKPDLVLAGAYSEGSTVDMLRRLGIRVETLAPATSLADVRAGIVTMGRVLGREAQAAKMLADFDARLGRVPVTGARPTAATYAANGYSSGARSLAGEIITQAGFRHLADDLGVTQGAFLPLEALVMANPDLVVLGDRTVGHSLAEELLDHPALLALGGGRTQIEGRDWICGLPSVLDAVDRLAGLRIEIGARP